MVLKENPVALGSEMEARFLIENAEISQVLDLLAAGDRVVEDLGMVNLVDCFLDTPDWRVLQAGWTYGWRDAAGKRVVRLRTVGANGNAVEQGRGLEQQVSAFPSSGHRIPKGPVAQRLRAFGQKKLRQLFQVQNCRRVVNVRAAHGDVIEVAIDQAKITAIAPSGKSAPGQLEFEELRLLLQEGSEESFRSLIETIRSQIGLLESRSSQFERGLQTLGVSLPPGKISNEARLFEQSKSVRKLQAARLGIDEPVLKLACRCLVERFEEMLVQEPRAWEGLDPEGVHQMRVATRRIRAAFRAFRKLLPVSAVREFNQEFKWVAAVLGDVRDLDVYRENFQHDTTAMPHQDRVCLDAYEEHLAHDWRTARTSLLECLSSQRYKNLKDGFGAFLVSEISGPAKRWAGSLTIGDAARRFIDKQYRKVLSDGRSIGESTADEKLHELRVDCKRLRYLFEFFHPIYGRSLSRSIRRVKRLQDVLGEFQDACVATQRLRQYADRVALGTDSRGELLALGQLINTHYQEAANKRAEFHRVWKEFDRKGGRKNLLSVLDHVSE